MAYSTAHMLEHCNKERGRLHSAEKDILDQLQKLHNDGIQLNGYQMSMLATIHLKASGNDASHTEETDRPL